MKTIVFVKTNRTKNGYAKGEIHRFFNYTSNKINYSFKFYQTHVFFNTYRQLKDYIDKNYNLLEYDPLDGMVEYHLPENRNDFLKKMFF